VILAALILADSDVEITGDKLLALTKAAKVEVEPVSGKATLLFSNSKNIMQY
jgi:ribosomal protein L12E/L44/L45/RPP1/RPP2